MLVLTQLMTNKVNKIIASEVETIVCDKHGLLYGIEKLNSSGHTCMVNIGKHDSYENPPDLHILEAEKGSTLLTCLPAQVLLAAALVEY